jgi:protein SERAC1
MLAISIGLLKQTNAQILAVLASDSEVLARIQDNFHTMIRSQIKDGHPLIEITCFYEELPLPGVGVVSYAVCLRSSYAR